MTPAKKRKHIKALKDTVESKGFKLDRYGNYKFIGKEVFRLKFKKNNLRFEVQRGKHWFKIFSKTIVKIDTDKFSDYLNYRVV